MTQQSEANKHEGIENRLRAVVALELHAPASSADGWEEALATADITLDALIAHLSASPEDLAALVVACGWVQVGWCGYVERDEGANWADRYDEYEDELEPLREDQSSEVYVNGRKKPWHLRPVFRAPKFTTPQVEEPEPHSPSQDTQTP